MTEFNGYDIIDLEALESLESDTCPVTGAPCLEIDTCRINMELLEEEFGVGDSSCGRTAIVGTDLIIALGSPRDHRPAVGHEGENQ